MNTVKKIILEKSNSQIVVKKSKFIGELSPCYSEEEAKKIIESTKKLYYDARHVCSAYVIDSGIVKYSDDGEPQGTAGKPMLELLQVRNLTNAIITVTRYFGGILLGANGLVHAYKNTANEAINSAKTYDLLIGTLINFEIDYQNISIIKKYEEMNKGKMFLQNEDYLEKAKFVYLIEDSFLEKFNKDLTNLTKGNVIITFGDKIKFVLINDNKAQVIDK